MGATIQQITSNEVYRQVMADSFGGIMYDVSNRNKYDTEELMQLWAELTPSDKESAGGIIKGAINFLES